MNLVYSRSWFGRSPAKTIHRKIRKTRFLYENHIYSHYIATDSDKSGQTSIFLYF